MVKPTIQERLEKASQYGGQAEFHREEQRKHRDLYLECARAAGVELNTAKAQCREEYGRIRDIWGPLLEEYFPGSVRNAQNYMLVASEWEWLQSLGDKMSDSIDGCLKLLRKKRKRQLAKRPLNYWHLHARDRLIQGLRKLWTTSVDHVDRQIKSQQLHAQYRRTLSKYAVPPRTPGTGCFADSGAFTLQTNAGTYAEIHKCESPAYFDTDEFFHYMDDYGEWVQANKDNLLYYFNLDVIGEPNLTWRNQQYLETVHQLRPVPVVHFGSDLDWLRHYIELKHEIIGVGGMVGKVDTAECQAWLEAAFNIVCDTPDRLPRVRIHGFGVSSVPTLHRFPFWSVDFTTWNEVAANGQILVPRRRDGEFLFQEPADAIQVDEGIKKTASNCYSKLSPEDQHRVDEWLDFVDVFMGKEELCFGVSTHYSERREANLRYYEILQTKLPSYPWGFHPSETA